MSRGFHSNWWQGTAAERGAFSTALLAVPFFWYETDTRDTYQWDGVAWLSIDVGGSGVANQVAYWTGPSVLAGDAGMTYNAGTDILSVGSVIVPDDGWVGCAADEERIRFDSSGHDIYLYAPVVYVYAETNDNAMLYIRSGGANKSSSIYLYEGGTGRWLFGYAALANQFYFQQGGNDVVVFKDGLVANSLVLDPTGHVITAPDNLADALHVVDAGGLEYMRIISTNAGPAQAVVFNKGGVDVDFCAEAVGHVDALVVQGSDGQITLGVLTAGYVKSNAGGVLSVATEVPLIDLASYTQGDLIYGDVADWQELAHPGAANRVLQSTAAEVGWSANAVTFPTAGAVPVGSGVANQVAYWTAASTLAGDAGMTYNAATDTLTIGLVGVGTAAPTTILDVVGGIRATAKAFTAPTGGTGLELNHRTADDASHVTAFDRTGAVYKNMILECLNLYLAPGGIAAVTVSNAGTVTMGNLAGGGNQDVGADNVGLLYVPFVSDKQFKAEVEPITGALKAVCGLRGVTFDWNEEEVAKIGLDFSGSGRQIGLIAQEVEPHIPLAVMAPKGYKSVDIKKITPYLVEAIKELGGRLEKLEAI